MLKNNLCFISDLQFIRNLNAFLKKISQKTSYTTFDKPFIPIQNSSKFFATNIGSTFQHTFNMFSV